MEITVMSRLKIHHLADAGLPHVEIARQIGCCERAVRKILADPPPTSAEVAAGQLARRGPGAPCKTTVYADRIAALLAGQPRLPTM